MVAALLVEMRAAWTAPAQAPADHRRAERGRGGRPVLDPADSRASSARWSRRRAPISTARSAAPQAAQPALGRRAGRRAGARCCERLADLLERDRDGADGAGRPRGRQDRSPTRIGEVREAADFCRYYAVQARAASRRCGCPGRPARATSCSLHGRGVFACISPWNFPLAIFTRPDRRRPGGRQRGGRQAGAADAADRRRRRAPGARGRRAARRAAPGPRRARRSARR